MCQKLLFNKVPKILKAFALKRCLRLREILPGNVFLFDIYSLTQAGRDIEHHLEADLTTGALHCSCQDFTFRHARYNPSIGDPRHICKHLHRVLDWLLRKKYLHGREIAVRVLMEQLRPCCECGVVDAEYGLCNEHGAPIDGFICRGCSDLKRDERARRQDDHYARLDELERRLRQDRRRFQHMKSNRDLARTGSQDAPIWKHDDEARFRSLRTQLVVLKTEHADLLGVAN